MSWKLSKHRAGDFVQIRSKEEILATLDENGCVDGMPFMPEMLQYCGKVIPVSAVAHKTCETAYKTYQGRRLDETIHLTGTRCDGSAHGGCQASCTLFWKDAWVKAPDDPAARPTLQSASGCNEQQLVTLQRSTTANGIRYSCQATKVTGASKPLAWWNPMQYVRDVWTGNHSIGHVAGVLWLAFVKKLWDRSPLGWRFLRWLRNTTHQRLTGREVPDFQGRLGVGASTPAVRLDLQPGEQVRIKSKTEIEDTLDARGKNRGMYFDVELSLYCGRNATVLGNVTQIIDEATGEMMTMKQPCVLLEGVVCQSQYSKCRLMCPRAIPSFWREAWLERLPVEQSDARVLPASGARVSELV